MLGQNSRESLPDALTAGHDAEQPLAGDDEVRRLAANLVDHVPGVREGRAAPDVPDDAEQAFLGCGRGPIAERLALGGPIPAARRTLPGRERGPGRFGLGSVAHLTHHPHAVPAGDELTHRFDAGVTLPPPSHVVNRKFIRFVTSVS